ncbi:MAG: AmmeMemoRadiSam system protein A [Anaerolineaceae bacterium]|jgi:hypothetical protein
MDTPLIDSEKRFLLTLARETIANALQNLPEPEVDEEHLSPSLCAYGASFVTLTRHGSLRGCIGSLEAHQCLALDVREHAYQAAFEDYRFQPLSAEEFLDTRIEVSRLTVPVPLEYEKPADLPGLLKPGVDGVILQDGYRRATFLPQVWEQLPNEVEFLSHLCAKMEAPADLWCKKKLGVSIYRVEEFHE